ncbi:unnamed protein product [marine sediment metagenome]|uniref:Uncharacterized protein n=1 Tax=marine sediment metagenome TaxID=412755 RepID=X0ZCN4_9ZZZZ
MTGDGSLLYFYNILRNYSILNVETLLQISTGRKVHFSLPFPTYFTLKTKSEFGTSRTEKGVEDNFLNKHPILIK